MMAPTNAEEDECHCSCSCRGDGGAEVNLCRQQTLIQLLRHRDTQMQRLVRLFVTAAVLLISLVLVLLLMFMFAAGKHNSSDCQLMMHQDAHSSAVSSKQKQHQRTENPSAMVTAASSYSPERAFLEWEDKLGHAHLYGGFIYSNGNLVVPKDGNYRVYLQITYEKHHNFSCKEEELRLVHSVLKFQQSYPANVTLMTMEDTMICNTHMRSKSLYTAGVFPLKATDRLWVKSNYPELIAVEQQKVFFGADLEPH